MLKLIHINEIMEDHPVIVQDFKGQKYAVFKIEGQIYVLDNACPHQGGPLGEGKCENFQVSCPWHAWEFDVRTGECMTYPGEEPAKTYSVMIQNGFVYIDD